MDRASDEMTLARADRKRLAARLLCTLTDKPSGVHLLANLVFQDNQRANEWLRAPKARLGGVPPMDFAADSLGHEAVESWLHEIDQGYFS